MKEWLRTWWHGKFWVWPWEPWCWHGPVFWLYGLGYWHLCWSDCCEEHRGWSVGWNIDR